MSEVCEQVRDVRGPDIKVECVMDAQCIRAILTIMQGMMYIIEKQDARIRRLECHEIADQNREQRI